MAKMIGNAVDFLLTTTSFEKEAVTGLSIIGNTNILPYNGTAIIDLSETRDRSILGWIEGSSIRVVSSEIIVFPDDCSFMFYSFRKLESIYFEAIDTSCVVDMRCMFTNCNSLRSLDVSNFSIPKYVIRDFMFYGCNHII